MNKQLKLTHKHYISWSLNGEQWFKLVFLSEDNNTSLEQLMRNEPASRFTIGDSYEISTIVAGC